MAGIIDDPNSSQNFYLHQDTEKLLRQYLKLQIASYYWSLIWKIIFILIMVGSIVYSFIFLKESKSIINQAVEVFLNSKGISSSSSSLDLNSIIKTLPMEQQKQAKDLIEK
ncbi:hypothetical protein GYA19_02015 [Candidatus Beckwithbacteria bacterium]|nr:hypothetical protein [Candidatus Beckwithbacteria bacterium]